MYREMFGISGKVQRLELTFLELRATLSERFDLRNLDKIFSSWKQEWNKCARALPSQPNDRLTVYYTHDHHTYRSDMYVSNYIDNEVENSMLCIKLANNGFLYPPEKELKIFKEDVHRYGGLWAILDKDHASDFSEIITFCKNYFGRETLKVQMFYSFKADRCEVKAFYDNKVLLVSFEPGYPCNADFDEDYWAEV